MDATAIATLQVQLRVLSATLDRLERARRDLVPAAATFWRGPARESYDRAVVGVGDELGSVMQLVGLARENTLLALREELGSG